MRIAYIARHGQDNNDDEGAISYALRQLGHQVVEYSEQESVPRITRLNCDLLLFHKWKQPLILQRVKVPTAFWYFDLVNWPDPALRRRNSSRITWMKQIMPSVTTGFCTDGDWVNAQSNFNLVRLVQGADERIIGADTIPKVKGRILFTGIGRGGGKRREGFVDWMVNQYNKDFYYVTQGMYRKDLARVISMSEIVVAPDSPVTDNYWSNRVYVALGFGAFMLHPYCKTLTDHYQEGKEIVYYHSRQDLREKIAFYRQRPELRRAISEAALSRTKTEHTYRHRCEYLVSTLQERIDEKVRQRQ